MTSRDAECKFPDHSGVHTEVKAFIGNPGLRPNGRIRGAYVYLLLCESENKIHVKAGRSIDPIKRLDALLTGCPLIPGILAVCELPTRAQCADAELALHTAFDAWHTRGEWFCFAPADKGGFNFAWRIALAKFETSMWRPRWTKINVQSLLAQARKRRDFSQHKFSTGGAAFRDFSRDGGRIVNID